jgi:peptidyl-tRNA hydrolase
MSKNKNENKLKDIFENEDSYIMYVLINSDINMSLSKMMRQCCDSIIKVVRTNEQRYNVAYPYEQWLTNNVVAGTQGGGDTEKKVFLKGKQEDLLYAVNNYSVSQNEEIWCQHCLDLNDDSPFTITCVAFTPIKRKDVPEFILDLIIL